MSGLVRTSGFSAVWSPSYEVDIGPHVFVTAKYRRVVEEVVGRGWMAREDFQEPKPASWDELSLVHTPAYLNKIRRNKLSSTERWLLEVPFSEALVKASLLSCGGTVQTARTALSRWVGVHVGGGFHHAFSDHGEGFCLLNDIALAAALLLEEGAVGRVAVVDLDVHQGNGTAAIFADEERVFTFSMHQENNYPFPKQHSDLDVGLEDGVGDEEYLNLLRTHLERALAPRPDLILYLAGADPYREDQLGGLALSMEGLRQRDVIVFAAARERGIPVAVTLAGGYARRLRDTVSIHVATVEEAMKLYIDAPSPPAPRSA
ncbi:MAG: histone deacetylase [Gemmatimonadota bacterium]